MRTAVLANCNIKVWLWSFYVSSPRECYNKKPSSIRNNTYPLIIILSMNNFRCHPPRTPNRWQRLCTVRVNSRLQQNFCIKLPSYLLNLILTKWKCETFLLQSLSIAKCNCGDRYKSCYIVPKNSPRTETRLPAALQKKLYKSRYIQFSNISSRTDTGLAKHSS